MLSLMCSVLLTAEGSLKSSAAVPIFINLPSKSTTSFAVLRKPIYRNPATSCCTWTTPSSGRVTHYMALAFDPNGSGIVFARPGRQSGHPEAGPNDTLWVGTPDLLPHLKEYTGEGKVWIRRRCVPLTQEQSCRLTESGFSARRQAFRLGPARPAVDAVPQSGTDSHVFYWQAERRSGVVFFAPNWSARLAWWLA